MRCSLLLLVLTLSGCGSEPADSNPPDTGEPETGGETGPTDDTAPPAPWWWGTGRDGDLEVMGRVDPSNWMSYGRTSADAVTFRVDTTTASTVSTTPWSTGLTVGDEVLLIDLQGTPDAHQAVGSFAFAHVTSVADAIVTVAEDLSTLLPDLVGRDLTGQHVRIQRVPQYARVTVHETGALTTEDWDGEAGGVLAFRASEGVRVELGGRITVDDAGYAGGSTGSTTGCDGFQGESLGGPGIGGQCGIPFNEAIGAFAANLGGGGANVTGGGGNHAGGATAGDPWRATASPPAAGELHGDPPMGRIFLGSGGGGVWQGSGEPGSGGAGGGIVIVGASSVVVAGSEGLLARGETALAWSRGASTFGAGGGAGGSILVVADEVDLAWNSVIATGGAGEQAHDRHGGDGGEGRIRIDCITCNGEPGGTEAARQAMAEAVNPDPGWSEVPAR